MKNKLIVSIILNAAIIIMAVVGLTFPLLGINWMGLPYSTTGTVVIVLFTYQSNVFMIVPAAFLIVYEFLLLRGKITVIPTFVYATKLALSVGVTITLLVVLFFLAPMNEYGYFASFANSSLFFHLLLPLCAIVSFVFFENTKSVKFHLVFLGMIHMVLYMLAYTIFVFSNLEGGAINPYYDFYGFFSAGIWMTPILFMIFLSLSFFVSLVLWHFNRKLAV